MGHVNTRECIIKQLREGPPREYDGRVIYFIETFASRNQTARLKRRASSQVEAPPLITFKLKLKWFNNKKIAKCSPYAELFFTVSLISFAYDIWQV